MPKRSDKGIRVALKKQEENSEEREKKRNLIVAGEKEILDEFKNNLPEYMEARLAALTQELVNTESVKGLSSIEIGEVLRCPARWGNRKFKYTTEQLQIVFDYYRQAIIEVNKKTKYPPTKENFCAFAGISTSVYNNYLNSAEESRQELMLEIDDYIRENQLTAAQLKEVDNITTMFRGKTAHGLVEAQSPIVVQHKSEVDTNKIMEMINTVKKGKSLKSIELEKEDYKVED